MDPDKVALVVLSHYQSLPASSKPIVRSNGVQEWTVLAGIAAVVGSETIPLTVATGVKAMPDEVRLYSHGKIVHDLHAEILAIRLFNLWLLQECLALKECANGSLLVEEYEGAFRLRTGIQLALYISEPPCGDASLAYMAGDRESWSGGVQDLTAKRQKILRGRSFFGRLGEVRTKPGRSDSLLTLSKSCSDKLCAKQVLGLTNTLTAPLFPENCFLRAIVLEQDVKADFDRSFARVSSEHPLELLKCTRVFHNGKPKLVEGSDIVYAPSPLLALKIVPSSTTQVLSNGVKNGSYSKGKPPKKGGESIVSNWSMARLAQRVYEVREETYDGLKTGMASRQLLKKAVREQLLLWVQTLTDDFLMP